MITSVNGRNLIKRYEGLRTKAYKCPAGVWTIGWGHTAGVRSGDIITKEQAERLLTQDLAKFEKAVNIYMSRYNFNQNEYDALVSFAFNLGAGNLHKLLAKGLRKRDAIADKMLAYNKANGKVLAGLNNRRHDERALFLTPVSSTKAMGIDYSRVFNADYYANHYSDLKDAFGYDAKSLFQHFLAHGMNERRQANADFNVDVYLKYNPDVASAFTKDGIVNYPKVYEHYCTLGYKEMYNGKLRRAN